MSAHPCISLSRSFLNLAVFIQPCSILIYLIAVRSCSILKHFSRVLTGFRFKIITSAINPLPSGYHSTLGYICIRTVEIPGALLIFDPSGMHSSLKTIGLLIKIVLFSINNSFSCFHNSGIRIQIIPAGCRMDPALRKASICCLIFPVLTFTDPASLIRCRPSCNCRTITSHRLCCSHNSQAYSKRLFLNLVCSHFSSPSITQLHLKISIC